MSSDDLTCAVELPEDWFGLSIEEDPEEFGRSFASTVAAELREQRRTELTADHIADLAADIARFTEHARATGALFAAVHIPDPAGPVLALLECHPVDPVESGFARDLAGLARQFEEPDPSVAWSEVTSVELPAGEAVRVHEITAAPVTDQAGPGTHDAGDRSTEEPSTEAADRGRRAVERVVHLLPVDRGDLVVALSMSWTALAVTEELTAMADGIAATLRIS